MNKLVLSLDFAGVVLPIVSDEQGRDVVPLKPISDLFGLEWARQFKKTSSKDSTSVVPAPNAGPTGDDDWAAVRLGRCLVSLPWAGQTREMVCIRVDRVAAFLNTINPNKVHAAGNVRGAEFLTRKQMEWDDVLHAYELASGQFLQRTKAEAAAKVLNIRTYLAIAKEKRATEKPHDRAALEALQAKVATDLGIAFQPELTPASNG
ncbi:MAG: hypothetical protein KIT73_14715 [Burkholderiales bacterium]|nr:hypothetical protein [Burkholderiales bacterium]